MVIDPNEVTRQEQALDEILADYLKTVDAGRKPNRQDLLARYPQWAADLEDFFHEEDRLERWAEPFVGAARSARLSETPGAEADLPSTANEGEDRVSTWAGQRFGEYELLEPIA